MSPRPLRLATRSSPLALCQARLVADALAAAEGGGAAELVLLDSRADRQPSVPIERFGERGVFVAEIEQAVLDGRADVAVHSAKDLPSTSPPPGLVLAAVPPRGEVRDALVGRSLAELGPGAQVATGSVRRRVQLASFRPDLGFVALRGNIGTRLGKVPPGGAVVVALAALERLGLTDEAAEILPLWLMLPQVGQGALALRCREGDRDTLERVAVLDHPASHRALLAERAFLARLGGGCDAPVAAFATVAVDGPAAGDGLAAGIGPGQPAAGIGSSQPAAGIGPGAVSEVGRPGAGGEPSEVTLEAMLAGGDGHVVLRARAAGADPEALGALLADRLLGEAGGRSLVAPAPAASG